MNARGEKFAQASRWMRVVLRSWWCRVSLKFGVHDVIVLFLFATMGFHIARLGFFGPQRSCYKGSLLYKGMKSCPNRLRLWPKTLATDELATQWAKPVWLYALCHCIGVIDPPSLVFFIHFSSIWHCHKICYRLLKSCISSADQHDIWP